MPLISVIIAVFNAEKYLEQSILSILAQSYRNFELIILDGCSTDNSVSIINKYTQHIQYWVSEPDKGIYDAWNKGLMIAKGSWITFIGADDLLLPNAFQEYINHISQHPKQQQLEFVSSKIEIVNEDLSPICVVGDSWVWERFKKEMFTWHVGCFHSRGLFSTYGIFDSSYKISGDYELLLRPKNQLVTSFVNQLTAKMRIGGVSNVRLFQAVDETYRAKVKNGVIPAYKGYILSKVDKLRLFVRTKTGWKNF